MDKYTSLPMLRICNTEKPALGSTLGEKYNTSQVMKQLTACIGTLSAIQKTGTSELPKRLVDAWKELASITDSIKGLARISDEQRDSLVSLVIQSLQDTSEGVRASAVQALNAIVRRGMVSANDCPSLNRALLKFDLIGRDEWRPVVDSSVKLLERGLVNAGRGLQDKWVEFFVSFYEADHTNLVTYMYQLAPFLLELLFHATAASVFQMLKSFHQGQAVESLRTRLILLTLSIPDKSVRTAAFDARVLEFVRNLRTEICEVIPRASNADLSHLVNSCAVVAYRLVIQPVVIFKNIVIEPSRSFDEELLLLVFTLEGTLEYAKAHERLGRALSAGLDGWSLDIFKNCRRSISARDQVSSNRVTELIWQILNRHIPGHQENQSRGAKLILNAAMEWYTLKSLFEISGSEWRNVPLSTITSALWGVSRSNSAMRSEDMGSRDPPELVGLTAFCIELVARQQESVSAFSDSKTGSTHDNLIDSLVNLVEVCILGVAIPFLALSPACCGTATRDCPLRLAEQSIELSTKLLRCLKSCSDAQFQGKDGVSFFAKRVRDVSRSALSTILPHLTESLADTLADRSVALSVAQAFFVNFKADYSFKLDPEIRIVYEPLDLLCKAVVECLDEPEIARQACEALSSCGGLPISESTTVDVLVMLHLNSESPDPYVSYGADTALGMITYDDPDIFKRLPQKSRSQVSEIEEMFGGGIDKEAKEEKKQYEESDDEEMEWSS